jgi:hypothetical protein
MIAAGMWLSFYFVNTLYLRNKASLTGRNFNEKPRKGLMKFTVGRKNKFYEFSCHTRNVEIDNVGSDENIWWLYFQMEIKIHSIHGQSLRGQSESIWIKNTAHLSILRWNTFMTNTLIQKWTLEFLIEEPQNVYKHCNGKRLVFLPNFCGRLAFSWMKNYTWIFSLMANRAA